MGHTYRISSSNNSQVSLERFSVNVPPYIPSRNSESGPRPPGLGALIRGRVGLLVRDALLKVLDPHLQTPITFGSDKIRFKKASGAERGRPSYRPKMS